MRLCVGTAKGIVFLDPDRNGAPLSVLADPPSVWCIAQDPHDPSLLYVGATAFASMGSARGGGTLARSTDAGKTWADITPPMARDEDVWAVATPPDSPREVFIGTSHARLFRSREMGRSFAECKAFLQIPGRDKWTFPPPPHVPHVRSIIFDCANPRAMYVGVEEGGVFRSRDRGDTFEPLNNGVYWDVHTVAADPNNPRRLYATTGGGFYASNDSGASWHQVKSGLNRSYTIPLLVDSGRSGTVFTAAAAGPPPTWRMGANGADAIMFRSTDSGESFEPISGENGPARGMMMRFVRDPADAERFFAATSDGAVLRVTNHGSKITPITEGLPPVNDLVAIP